MTSLNPTTRSNVKTMTAEPIVVFDDSLSLVAHPARYKSYRLYFHFLKLLDTISVSELFLAIRSNILYY
jgi:hypothetical protein